MFYYRFEQLETKLHPETIFVDNKTDLTCTYSIKNHWSFQPTPVITATTTSTPTTSLLLLLLLISDNNNSKPLFLNSELLGHFIYTKYYTKYLTCVKSFRPHKNSMRK